MDKGYPNWHNYMQRISLIIPIYKFNLISNTASSLNSCYVYN